MNPILICALALALASFSIAVASYLRARRLPTGSPIRFSPMELSEAPRPAPSMHWECEICGSSRPDGFIDVARHSVSKLMGVTQGAKATYNVKHCNDRFECVSAARSYYMATMRIQNELAEGKS